VVEREKRGAACGAAPTKSTAGRMEGTNLQDESYSQDSTACSQIRNPIVTRWIARKHKQALGTQTVTMQGRSGDCTHGIGMRCHSLLVVACHTSWTEPAYIYS